jgi:hypothetical protein
MAEAFRIDDAGQVLIRAGFSFPPDARHRYALKIGGVVYHLPEARRLNDVLVIANWQFHVERIVNMAGTNPIQFMVLDEGDTAILLIEPLTFAASFFLPFFDFARNTKMPPHALGDYRQPELLAVFTHVHNDPGGLALWQHYYAGLVEHRHMYVIDHASTTSPSAMLHPDVRVVPIPRGEIDHFNISQFCAYFQRFLLTQYRWVMHVDSDEILVHRRGHAGLLEQIKGAEYGPIVRPAEAFELLDHTAGTEPVDFAKPLSLQRHVTNVAPDYRKPILGRDPISWCIGFHQALDDSRMMVDPDMVLIHVRYACLHFAARREGIWTDAPQSASAAAHTSQAGRCSDLAGLAAKLDRQFSNARGTLPEWTIGLF